MRRREVTALLRQHEAEVVRFTYGPDSFARLLLGYAKERYPSIRDLRASPFERLLARPSIAAHFRRMSPEPALDAAVNSHAADPALTYRITLGRWGYSEPSDWPCGDQTSRPGENLVLQLNFTRTHNRAYHRLIRPGFHPFRYSCHPVHEQHLTMAWARIDLDLDSSEATIEEVQNDWLREATELAKEVRHDPGAEDLGSRLNDDVTRTDFLAYVDFVLAPHVEHWADVMLSAAIWWLRERRGIRRIFYHTFDTGNRLKALDEGFAPPRSLYTKLPRRFCFVETRTPPRALARSRVQKVQECLRNDDRGEGERIFEGGPFRALRHRPRHDPSWWLLEI